MSEAKDFSPVDVEELFDERLDPPARRRPRSTAREAVIDVALSRAMTSAMRRAVVNKDTRAVVVTVPDAAWVEPILDGIGDLVDDSLVKVARPVVALNRNEFGGQIARALSSGRTVAGASPQPETALPEILLNVCDLKMTIDPPDSDMVLECIRRCLPGRLPAGGKDIDPRCLTFDELISLIGHRGNRASALDRIRAAISNKTSSSSKHGLPDLEEAIEYGEARQWALDLRDDIRDAMAGRISWDMVDRGVCLFGPPGTGKTMLGQMLGEACGIPTIVSSIGELFAGGSGYLDVVIKALRKVFADAKAQAPCVIFLDEINAMPRIDALGHNGDYWRPLILDFYTLLDGALNDRSGVIVVGATNSIADIHPALLRPGRLERALHVGPPDAAGTERIFRHHLGDDLRAADISVISQVCSTREATGAEIMEMVRAARRTARRAGRPLEIGDIESRAFPPDTRDPSQRRRIAVHEAGHAIVAAAVGGIEVGAVSIIGHEGAGGITRFVGCQIRNDMTRAELDAICMVMLGGRVAERLVLGEPAGGSGGGETSDLGIATRVAAMMIGGLGMGAGLSFT